MSAFVVESSTRKGELAKGCVTLQPSHNLVPTASEDMQTLFWIDMQGDPSPQKVKDPDVGPHTYALEVADIELEVR